MQLFCILRFKFFYIGSSFNFSTGRKEYRYLPGYESFELLSAHGREQAVFPRFPHDLDFF